jgi:hypothetical protein
MVQILNTKPGLGELFGTGLGSGLSQTFNQLADVKTKQYSQNLERQRYASGLAPLLGQQTADFLSQLNPEERKYALQNVGSLMKLTSQGGNVGEFGAPDKLGLIEDVFTSPAEKRAKEELDLRRQSLDLRREESQANRQSREELAKEKLEAAKAKTQEAERYKRQTEINAKNKQAIDKYNSSRETIEKADDLLTAMEEAIESGNVAQGWSGTLQANFPSLQNDVTAKYVANATELPTLISALPGISSDFKTRLAQKSKAFINQPLAAQKALLDQARSYVDKRKAKIQALDNILESSGQNQPPNIAQEVEKEVQRMNKQNRKATEFKPGDTFTQSDYDHPEKFPDGFAVEWDGLPQQIVKGKWVVIDEEI